MTIPPSVPSLAHLRLLDVSGVELAEQRRTRSILLLHPTTPNPFNPSAKIRFDLSEAGHVHLAVYGVTGRLVTTLSDRDYEAGSHSATWHGVDSEGREVGAGVYYILLKSGNYEAAGEVILLK
jgi:hypothetical protein